MINCPLLGLPLKDFRKTQGFGTDPAHYRQYGLKGHNGYDLAPAKPGQQGVIVYAAHEGYLHQYDEGDKGYGRYVELFSQGIDGEGEKMKTIYGHLASFLTPAGAYVHQGDPIGVMGSTGDSTNTHLHFTFKKLDMVGNTLNWNNGYKGALDIGKYIRLVYSQTLV